MGRICLFLRVSTLGQQLESQEDLLRRAALADGYNEEDFIVIGKKESAIKLSEEEREGLNELKSVIDTEEIDCVYIAELSRLSRRPQILYSIREYLLQHKIQLKCLHPQFTLLTEDRSKYDATANIVFSLFGALAEQEMLEKKERFARGKRRKAEEGKYNGGAIPFGYRIDKDRDNLIVIDEEDSKIVKEIFDKYEKGFSQPKLAKEMEETGHKYVTISLINNVLNNESYCGVKRKSVNASYERAYPPIITVEQYKRCRKIAETNNTTANKAKNVYYAEHLVQCQSCGAYWSASGSKNSYHCSAAVKPNSIWKYEIHKKPKCTNKTSLSINILDSILWEVAIDKEVEYIETMTEENINAFRNEAKVLESKITNIQPRIDDLRKKRDRLREMYIDGLSKEAYDRKSASIVAEMNEIKAEELQFKDELTHIYESIEQLGNYKKLRLEYINQIHEVIEGERDTIDVEDERYLLRMRISNISDDKERHKIIHRQISSVEVIPRRVSYPFKIGRKDINAKEIIVHTFRSTPFQKELYGEEEGARWFYVIPCGGFGGQGALILDMIPGEVEDDTSTMLYCYDDDKYYPFDEIQEAIYLDRFYDLTKRKKRAKEREEKKKVINGRLSISEISKKYGISYVTVFSRIKEGRLKAEFLYGQYFVYPQVAEEYFKKEKEKLVVIGNRLSIIEVSRKYGVGFAVVHKRVKEGIIPSEFVNGKYLIKPEDAEKYFSSEYRKRQIIKNMLPASAVAEKYHLSYKSVLKKVRSGEVPSQRYRLYYYIDPKDAEDYFGKASAPLDEVKAM